MNYKNYFNINIKLLFFVALFSLSAAFGQSYRFIDYKKQQIFDQSQILSIMQDSWGFLWIGTGNGLFRYDSEEWLQLTIEDGLPDNLVTALAEDDSMRLWVGTGHGLACIDLKNYNNPTVCPALGITDFKKQVHSLCFWENNLWIGILYGGAYRLKEGSLISLQEELKISALSTVFGIEIIDETRLGIIVEEKGLLLVDKNGEIIDHYQTIGDDQPVSISCYRQKQKSLIGGKKNLYEYDPQTQIFKALLPAEIAKYQPYIFESVTDSDGIVWAVSDRGLIRYSKERTELITKDNGLPNNAVRDLFIDRENNLWIGSISAGLFKLTNRDMISYDEASGLTSGVVNSIISENESHKLIGTDAGVCRLENMKLSRDRRFRTADNDIIWRIYQDSRHRIWVAGENILDYYHQGKYVANPYPRISASNVIMDMLEDSQGRYWFGTVKGIYLVENSRSRFIQEFQNLPIRNVSAIHELSDGTILFGTNLGLLVKSDQEMKYYTSSENFPARVIHEIFRSKKNELWLGSDYGLLRKEGDSFKLFAKESGFKGLVITQIMEDDDGILWICTENGLHRFDGEKVTAIINSRDGLISNEFVTRNSSMIDKDGKFFLGMFGGLSVINPPSVSDSLKITPLIKLKKAQAYNEDGEWIDMSVETNRIIPYFTRNFIFDFMGLYYQAENDLMFEYRLIGESDTWNTIGRSGEVRYHSLNPGEYHLQYRGLIDGRMTTQQQELTFKIERPFWQQVWFVLLMMIFMTGILYLGKILLMHQQRRRNKRLAKLVKARTFELEHTKAQLENIIENAGSAIVTVNIDGTIHGWNKKAEELFGYTKEEIHDNNIEKLDLSDDQYPFTDILTETDNSGQMYQLELKKRTKAEKEVDLMLTTSHLKDDERYTIVMEDFTARNQLVQNLMNREKLLGAIGALNKLLATLSHYINNALMAITGMSQLSKMDKKYYKRFIETTDNQSLRIQAVIKSLSDLVQSLNLKARNYIGDQSQLFDIEKEISKYIELISKDISESEATPKLPGQNTESNDVY